MPSQHGVSAELPFSRGHGKWVQQGRITSGDLQQASGIAVYKNGDIAVADPMKKCVIKYFMSTIKQNTYIEHCKCKKLIGYGNYDAHDYASKLEFRDVAVTSRDHAVMPFMLNEAQHALLTIAYSNDKLQGTQLISSSITGFSSVTADSDGLIYAGAICGYIAILSPNELEGMPVKTINVQSDIVYLACMQSRPRKLLVTHHKDLKMYDLEGNVLFHVNPSIGGTGTETAGKAARALGVTCDEDDNVYLAVSFVEDNTGHIHKYSPRLEFQECIAQGLLQPQGMDYAKGCLYVATPDSFLVFRQENLNAEQQTSQQ